MDCLLKDFFDIYVTNLWEFIRSVGLLLYTPLSVLNLLILCVIEDGAKGTKGSLQGPRRHSALFLMTVSMYFLK